MGTTIIVGVKSAIAFLLPAIAECDRILPNAEVEHQQSVDTDGMPYTPYLNQDNQADELWINWANSA